MSDITNYQKDTTSLSIDGVDIEFVDNVEHVGVVRSVDGNLPNIQARIVAHKRELGAVLHTGLARNHRGNVAASIRIDKIYGVPVLLSGLSSLVLKSWFYCIRKLCLMYDLPHPLLLLEKPFSKLQLTHSKQGFGILGGQTQDRSS